MTFNKFVSLLELSKNIPPNTARLFYLQKRDNHFIKVSKRTLRLFELWFFVHWVLVPTQHLNIHQPHLRNTPNKAHPPQLLVV